ncbi:MAG TPA: penicillin acylase family protein [Bryobacteraceae bacterium]
MQHFPRLVRTLNLSIAVLAVLIAAFLYMKVYEPLPTVSGSITAPITGAAEIRRDSRGIPHIAASSSEDVLFLEGYAMAQDRLFQMDGIRRLAAGDLAEVVGKGALDLDIEARRLRLRRVAEDHARAMRPEDRAVIAAFARGVNYFIETHRDSLPIEFTLLGYQPRPWTIADTILAGLQMYRNLTTTWKHELQKMTLLASGDKAKVEFLYPPRAGTEISPGSNSWAIAGAHTATGKPILANDPHLDFALPSTWWMVHLTAPGLNVEGVTLPGIPCVVIGHNDQIAWGVTNLGFDVQDLYEEKLLNGGFEYQGKAEPGRVEREIVEVKGQQAIALEIVASRHGSIFHSEGNRIFALRWTAAEPGHYDFPFLDLNRAKNWDEFRTALRRFPGPGQNFTYADRDGNIGYQATGVLPIRRNFTGDVPANGSSGENEWDGFIPFDDLPSFFNPKDGFVVTANQNPFPVDYKYQVHGDFSPPYRANQIRALLKSHEQWKAGEMVTVQKDVYSPFSLFVAQQTVAAFDRVKPKNPALPPAIELLRGWNGQVEKGTPAPLVAALLYQSIKKAMVDSAAPGKVEIYQDQMSPVVIERLLRERPAGWFKSYDDMLIAALGSAIEEGRKTQGSDVRRWDYGRYNELKLVQPVLGHVGDSVPLIGEWLNSMIGSYANIGPVEMSGSSTTVKQTTRRLGPSMRFAADLSNWNQSLMGLTVGESGQIGSSHYKDQWPVYYSGTNTPFAFEHVDASNVLHVTRQ